MATDDHTKPDAQSVSTIGPGPSRGSTGGSAALVTQMVPQFRKAQKSEIRFLEELQHRTAMVSRYREQILAHPDAIEIPLQAVIDGRARVALVDAQIVGFSVVLPSGEGLAELDGLFVEPEWQGRGLGRALLEDAFSEARDQGVQRIEVTSNLEAVEFYRKIGFAVDGPAATRFGPALRMHILIIAPDAASTPDSSSCQR